ncbi:phosphotriesterase family protein [Microcella sp.]|uniref:phosphotriesterase family protein n=1 Tax=Microcella sp. TaxID=1913979 RepID=UPI00256C246B|nr:phosphotriesterase-related protein [Microcella sp.]MBX9472395.1 phosphotriesterase-related protein [Microcella sp.]
MTGTVATVRGEVAVKDLGATLMHEHLFIRNPELEENYPTGEWDEDVMHAAALARMRALAAAGISTLVDLTVMGLGRSIPRIQRLAAESPVNIVVATGFYTQRDLPTYFSTHSRGGYIDEDPLAEMFIGDIREGIAGTGVKAAIIKVSSDRFGITDDVARVFAAAAAAHQQTGVPIATHSNPHVLGGLDQQARFTELGIDLQHVVIGHSGDTTDITYLRRLLDAGSTVGLDRFGMTITGVDTERVDTLHQLIELGYAEQLVVSHDSSLYSVNMAPTHKDRIMPEWTHLIVSEQVLPELRRRGVSEETIDQIIVGNPARILAGSH